MKIDGAGFLITGGASGLGLACAESLVRHGALVTILDLPTSAGEARAAALGARFVPANVTDEPAVATAVDTAIHFGGELRGVICCAGVALGERLVGKRGPHRQPTFERLLAVNVVGTFNVLRLAAARMIDNQPGEDGERGVLITTSSIAACEGQIGQVAYAASKGAVAAMTLPIARELAPHGIRCVSLAPGIFDTPLMDAMSDEVRASLAAQVPFPSRFGRREEFASLVEHVLQNVMLNGSAAAMSERPSVSVQ